jgi:hypothetical protein
VFTHNSFGATRGSFGEQSALIILFLKIMPPAHKIQEKNDLDAKEGGF